MASSRFKRLKTTSYNDPPVVAELLVTTKFGYWYQKNAPFPEFGENDTPKKYITEWFTEKAKGPAPPSDDDSVGELELVEAGLAAGYGKRGTWSGSLLLSKAARHRLYQYMRARLESVYSCVDFTNGEVRLNSVWHGIESSEKAGLSFALGSVGALIGARRWVSQYAGGPTVLRLLHARIFTDASIVRHPLGKPVKDGHLMPDFLVEDTDGCWHVFEAKGGDQGNRWRQLAHGIQQAKRIRKIGPIATMAPPRSAVCVQTLVDGEAVLAFTLVDPPSESEAQSSKPEAPTDVLMILVPELLDLGVAVDAIDWFHCLKDSEHTDEEAVIETLRRSESGMSSAFGGLALALPVEFIRMEEEIRAAARLLTTLVRIIDGMGSAPPSQAWPIAQDVVDETLRLKASPGVHPYHLDDIENVLTAAISVNKESSEGHLQQMVRALRLKSRAVSELVDELKAVASDFRSRTLVQPEDSSRTEGAVSVANGVLAVKKLAREGVA